MKNSSVRTILVIVFASLVSLGLTAWESVAEGTPDGVAPEVWPRIAPQMEANGVRISSGAKSFTLETKLTALDSAEQDSFGTSVSVAGDVALVGVGDVYNAGAAYVFERNSGGTNAWGQVAKLTASDSVAQDNFGFSVSVAGDVALVGAAYADPEGTDNAGAVYVFERNAGGTNAWGQVKKMTASDKAANDSFGWSVSVAGDVALVGAAYAAPEGVLYAGSVYVFERNAGGANAWGEVKKLTAADLAANDSFGCSVSVAGDVALVGAAYAAPEGASAAGAAYVFERNEGGANAWGQVKKLTASDKRANDNFGNSVSVEGDVALVGAYASDPGAMIAAGAAYVFERNAGGTNAWGQVKKLTASDKASADYFGVSVSVAGGVALVGAYASDPGTLISAGAAYLFERNAGGTNAWGQVKKLTASDKAAADYFGISVCVAADLILVGAYQADPGGTANAGAAYVIPFNREEWSETSKLTASDKEANDWFGFSVSVAGDVALVGAYGADFGGMYYAGAAYVFERNAGGTNAWGQVAKLTASDKAENDWFGFSVSVAGDVALVGAAGASPGGGYYAGAAYVFTRNAGGANAWGQVAKLTASDKSEDSWFGWSVSVAGDVALVGAYGADSGGIGGAGAVYVFTRNAGGANAWGQVKKLTASDKAANARFGNSVSVAGDVALVGAYNASPGGTIQAGAAYVFERNEGGANAWGEVKKLTASDMASADAFGYSVSVAGDMALVGAAYADPGGMTQAGAAYLFARDAGGANAWGQVAKLTAADKTPESYFGWSVSVAGNCALVGAYAASLEDVLYAGSAYVFARNAGGMNSWGEVKKLTASDKADSDYFGYSVSVAGDTALVGAIHADPGGTGNAGAVYVFEGLISNTTAAVCDMTVFGIYGQVVANGEAASSGKGTDFGLHPVGDSAVNYLSITNSGTAALIISGWSTNGSGAGAFQVSGIPAQVAAGAASNFSIVFSPTGEGAYAAAISIVNTSTNTPYVVNLAGSGGLPGQICLSASSYSAQEGTKRKILVKRINGSAGTVSVSYLMKQKTALAWQDYTPKSGTLTWLNGQTASKAIKIAIQADGNEEGNEVFQILLKNPVGTTLAAPKKATITILANNKGLAEAPDATALRMSRLTEALDGAGLTWFTSVSSCLRPARWY